MLDLLSQTQTMIIVIIFLAGLNVALVLTLMLRGHKGINPGRTAVPVTGRMAADDKPRLLSPEAKAELEAAAQKNFQALMVDATKDFSSDLKATSVKLNEQILRLSTMVIEDEFGQYRKVLSEVRKTAFASMSKVQSDIENQHTAMQAQVQSEVQTEKEHLVAKLDAKLADVVSSYLVESLGQGVDLGAQSEHIMQILGAHKDDLKKDLLGDA